MNLHNYIEWFDAQEMHEHSKEWFSELSFIKEEHLFLNNLITSFIIKSLDKKDFERLEDFKKSIAENQRRVIPLLKRVQKHMNQLEIIMDEVNQLEMEKAYKKTHKKLLMEVNQLGIDFRTIKQRGYSKLKTCLIKIREC